MQKLNEKELEFLKEYLFELQKQRFKRVDIKVLKKMVYGNISIKKESRKLLFDFNYYLMLQC